MDFEELLRKLQEQVNFWRQDSPTSSSALNSAKGTIRDIGRTADTYIGGSMGQSALRGPDALSRQIMLNAIGGLAGAGIGAGAAKATTKLAPKVEALMQWIKPRDVGIHLSPFNEIDAVLPNVNVNRGAGGIPNYPVIEGQTYKFSSKDYLNNNVTPNRLLDSAEKYITNIPLRNNDGLRSLYITRSKLGSVDPETQVLIDNMKNKVYSSWPVPSNGRITPNQEILRSIKFTVPEYIEQAKQGLSSLPLDTPVLESGRRLPNELRDDLLKLIAKQQSLEKMKSLARAGLVGGSAFGTALTPLAVARPVLGFNNKK